MTKLEEQLDDILLKFADAMYHQEMQDRPKYYNEKSSEAQKALQEAILAEVLEIIDITRKEANIYANTKISDRLNGWDMAHKIGNKQRIKAKEAFGG